MQLGIKVWSRDVIKNPQFFEQCVKAVHDGYFGYIELFPLAGSYDETATQIGQEFKGLKTIIHAPHSLFGLDTGNPELFDKNQEILHDSFRFADLLGAEIIIVHAGTGEGSQYLEETIRQFRLFNDARIAVENLPYQCSVTGTVLHGTTVEEIIRIKEETGCKFCLDFSHAICASNHWGRDAYQELDKFKQLNPEMYHLSDGEFASEIDSHRHFGAGDFDLRRLVKDYIAPQHPVTMETGHGIPTGIAPWLEDAKYITQLTL